MGWDAERAEDDTYDTVGVHSVSGKTQRPRWADLLTAPGYRDMLMEHERQEITMESALKRMRRNALAARIEAAEAQLREARMELAKMNGPEEPLSDFMDSHPLGRPVVTFNLRFEGRGRVYTYAAIRAVGRWHLTGSQMGHKPFTWHELMEWIEANGGAVDGIRLATEWETLPE